MAFKKKIIKYLFSNAVSNGVNFFSRWFLNYALARLMLLESFGIYSFIMAAANLCKGFISFGGQLFLIYKVAKEREQKYLIFAKSNLLSLFITGIAIIALLVIYPWASESEDTKYYLYAVVIGAIMAFTQNIYSFFKGLGLFGKEKSGYSVLLILTLVLIGLLYFEYTRNELLNILLIVFAMRLAVLFFASWQWIKFRRNDETVEDLSNLLSNFGKFAKERVSYGLHELQSILYVNATILVLGFVVKEEDLAIYKSLQLIIVPFSILPMIFSQVLLKQLTDHLKNNKSTSKLFRRFLLFTSGIGILLFLGIALFGSEIITLFYGDKLEEISFATEITLLLIIAYLFRFVSANYGVLITAYDKQKIRVYATSILILVTIFSTIVLCDYMGVVGAAYANAISYFTLMFMYVVYSELKLLR